MVFEFVFPARKSKSNCSAYLEHIPPESGVQLIESFSSTAVIEGDWDAAMSFLRQCHEYMQEDEDEVGAITTIHIHS